MFKAGIKRIQNSILNIINCCKQKPTSLRSKIIFHAIIATFLVFLIVLTCFIFLNEKTFSSIIEVDELDTYQKWDGSIAQSFSGGTGTKEDPYQIASGSEFIYFKSLIEGSESSTYNHLYYILTNHINFNHQQFSPIGIPDSSDPSKSNDHVFKGDFNGNGYSLANINLIPQKTIFNETYLGLFSLIENGSVRNLNIKNMTIQMDSDNSSKLFIGGVAGTLLTTEKSSFIQNIGIYDSNIILKNMSKEENKTSYIGGLIGYQSDSSKINNCYVHIKIDTSESSFIGQITGLLENNKEGSIKNCIIYSSEESEIIGKTESPIQYQNIYSYSGTEGTYQVFSYQYQQETNQYEEQIVENNLTNLANILTNGVDEEFVWHVDRDYIRFDNRSNIELVNQEKLSSFATIPTSTAVLLTLHDTGISGDTLYINDLESDYNYYIGKNYTNSSDGTLPSGDNQNLYNEKSLVKVYMDYSGEDINNPLKVGYVSTSERQNHYIYYKYYPVENGYVTIELIDNPFTDRPTDMGFNGWVTNYNGAEISYDSNYYTRSVKIPVTYQNGIPNLIEIRMNASWVPSRTYQITSTSNVWSTAFNNLDTVGMKEIGIRTAIYEDVTNLYYNRTVSRNSTYPTGAVNSSGSNIAGTRCTTSGGCSYYIRVGTNSYSDSETYYRFTGSTMVVYNVPIIGYDEDPNLSSGMSIAGFYRKVTIARTASYAGYYNDQGVYQVSGTCTTSAGCTYYELLQYYDSNQNPEQKNNDETYYYLVTRDTNIIIMQANTTTTWASGQNKPFTLTSVYNQNDYRNNVTWTTNVAVRAYNDTNIENIKINSGTGVNTSNPPTGTSTTRTLYGYWKNVRIGRGIIRVGSNTTFTSVVGGYSGTTGSASNTTKYRLVIESGFYSTISNAYTTGTSNNYIENKTIYGNDYDRVLNQNDNLTVYFCASGSWGGNLYAPTTIDIALDLTVKSGSFGTSKYDHTTGIYVGGRNAGTHYAARRAKIEGGWIYNLIGGPLTASNRTNYNDSYIYVTGGEIDMITGGAGTTATYGNRIIQVTSGTINYSVFGGSNGYNGSNGDGTLNGSSLVYIGGNAIIGSDQNVQNANVLFGSEAGAVFGNGNGRSGYPSIGSNDNSNIIIDGNAVIKGNVYGGGNYGATGVSSSSNQNRTTIDIKGGIVAGSIYGGGNNNGAGSTTKTATIIVDMSQGTVQGSIYGGAKSSGIVYGNINLNVIGGTVGNSVYGGGEGGYVNSSSSGTFISGNINIIIGNRSYDETPIIQKSVYGGSAFGTVNATSRSTTKSTSTTNVTINKGIITNVYGGGEGNFTYAPLVAGDIFVTLNGGKVTNVYGGNDASGSTNGEILLYLNEGIITSVYGGGNKVDSKRATIYLKGANVQDIYGGGNAAGVDEAKISLEQGSAVNVFGGANQSGTVATSNITSIASNSDSTSLLSFRIEPTVTEVPSWEVTENHSYATLKLIITNDSNYDITKWNLKFKTTNSSLRYNYTSSLITAENNIYTTDEANRYYGTNVIKAKSTFTIEFGVASTLLPEDFKIISTEISGTDSASNQYQSSSGGLAISNIYGGNNDGGKTGTTNINLQDIELNNVYGGGNSADITGNTNVKINNSKVLFNIYGGGNHGFVNGSSKLVIENSQIGSNVFGGGNAGNINKNASLIVSDSNISGSVYGGGNSADIIGNTDVLVAGSTDIGESLFGGGNSGTIGEEVSNSSSTVVNVMGATIEKNVYGGCNTSVVYGTTEVNIGSSAKSTTYKRNNIDIKGTVFGGGEANASGSEIYDFTFISVTKGIDISIDGTDYTTYNLALKGSVFGSGNASSSSGQSNIYIYNLGKKGAPNRAISIQRADKVVISNSVMELVGTTDRTNEYSSIKYSFNRINVLKIKNGTRLLLQQNANLLHEVQSLVDIDGVEKLATVSIDATGNTTRNVDNRIYLIANKNLNVTTNEAATSYGEVSGMTFLGMYTSYSNGSYSYGIYNLQNGDSADAGGIIVGGSYVLGLHPINSDTTKNGFYSNYINEEYTHVKTAYIEPTPANANYYMWAIGLDAINYSFTLTASKYASLGTHELSLIDFAQGNTIFEVVGFNAEGLTNGIELVDANEVPKLGANAEEANKIIGLSMKAETTEWTSHDTTKFLSKNGGESTGSDHYLTDNQATAPSLTFYLYHAKNISLDSDLGTVVVTLQALTPINEIEYDVSLITITIELNAKTYSDQAAYDASITYGKKYEMPSVTDVHITNKSAFTAYYSLYTDASSLETIYGKDNQNYHTLSSSYVLPVGTKITMLDIGANAVNPNYYYYIVTPEDYAASINQYNRDGESTYDLRKFVVMGSTSTNHTYSDTQNNQLYFHSDQQLVMEEFLFLFDFADTNISGNQLNNNIILELRTAEDRTSISVLGIRQNLMKYHLYETSNIVLNANVTTEDQYLYYDAEKNLLYDVIASYDQTANRQSIIDTAYESNSMGINITMLDPSGNQISSTMLVGTSIKMGNTIYYPSSDGVFRIKLSNKVSNLSKLLKLTIGSNLPSGEYKMKIDLFSSNDGLHSDFVNGHTEKIPFVLIGANNGIEATADSDSTIINGDTGLNLSGKNSLEYNIKQLSSLSNPNVRVVVYKRDNERYDNTTYHEIDLKALVSTTLTYPAVYGLKSTTDYEYMISNSPPSLLNYKLTLKNQLTSGTYKIVFRLYNLNQLIDEDEEYIIIKKGIIE